ncbi:hypothetical protein M8J75_004142 [Diaphorina citri]|nr:hypothetical protein M8J75_004142 [Diaphorina citri]
MRTTNTTKKNIEVIDKLRKEILQMKNKAIESEDNAIPSTSKTDDTQEAEILRLRTSLETMEAAWKVDQENLQKLRKQIEEQPPALGNLQFTQDLNDSVMSFRTSHSTDDTMEGEKNENSRDRVTKSRATRERRDQNFFCS